MSRDVQASWHRFLDVFEPMRPELYRYCRHLTRSAWDAEDLVQEALVRAFVTLGTVFRDLPNPRAWLFRVASNLWIDQVRRGRLELGAAAPEPVNAAPELLAERDAVEGTLSPITVDERGGVAPEFLEGYLGGSPTAELRAHADGWVVLFWYEHQQGRLVRTLMTVETCDQRIARVRNYFFAPEVIREVCAELSLSCAVNGYRYWQAEAS